MSNHPSILSLKKNNKLTPFESSRKSKQKEVCAPITIMNRSAEKMLR